MYIHLLGAIVLHIPHGNPHKSSPTSRISLLGAKKVMKMNPMRLSREI